MKKLLLAFLVFSFSKIDAQLTGSAFLNGLTNHSGIKVKFVSNSGTAITDSTLTDATGVYSINISGGVYKVEFSKTGYQTAYYNNNVNIILTNTTALNPINLAPGTIVNVGGVVSGNWINTNIYIVNNNLSIPTGSVLTIQPGTVVKFNGSYSLTADGILNATGNPANKIKFTSNNTSPSAGNWIGLYLNSSQSNVKHCLIEYASNAIFIRQSSPSVEDNEITKFSGAGISLNMNSSSLVKNNLIHDYKEAYGFGINTYGGNARIECNSIYDGRGRGMSIGDASIVKNNLVYNISGPERGFGIDIYYMNARVENNIIHDCYSAINYGQTVNPGPNPLIINNTIYNNTTGISSFGMYGNPTIIGNIIVNNANGILQGPDWGLTPAKISHNLLWNNSVKDFDYIPITGIGQIVNTNSNGDPVDAYLNVSKDPLFINGGPHYSPSSPCIGAGDSDYSNNIGCDVSGLCSKMVVGLKENNKDFHPLVFPNPFSTAITVRGVNTSLIKDAAFYDLTGKKFEAKLESKSESSLNLVQENLISGFYFLEITFSDSSKEYIRVIKE